MHVPEAALPRPLDIGNRAVNRNDRLEAKFGEGIEARVAFRRAARHESVVKGDEVVNTGEINGRRSRSNRHGGGIR